MAKKEFQAESRRLLELMINSRDECGRSCRMDLFYGGAKQILHRPEYSDRWTGSRKQ